MRLTRLLKSAIISAKGSEEMENWKARTQMLLGSEGVERLANASVAVFGIGGVGSYAAEALVRAGVGNLTFIDGDTVSVTNINRQLVADTSTVGKSKAEVMKERALLISPSVNVTALTFFYSKENSSQLPLEGFDFILDCIDSVSSKLELICKAEESGVPVISCMGAGNKLDPTRFEVEDIYKTSVCPLARVMRSELKKRGIKKLKVVYSKEEPIKRSDNPLESTSRPLPASISFVPSVAGLIMAGEAIKQLSCIK